MGKPHPADLSKTLDGLLTGLDSLMARREEVPGPAAAPLLRVDEPESIAMAEAVPSFLPWMTALAFAGLQPPAAAGMAPAAHQMLRQHLAGRLQVFRPNWHPNPPLSPRWAALVAALPGEARFTQDTVRGFVRLHGIGLTLEELRARAGPVGQTITAVPSAENDGVFRLPALPELGAAATVQIRGLTAARWSEKGPPAVFFWLDQLHPLRPECAGLALVALGRPVPVLMPPTGVGASSL